MIASHGCCRFVGSIWCESPTTFKKYSNGLRSSDRGGYLCTYHVQEISLIWALWHGALLCWKQPSDDVYAGNKGTQTARILRNTLTFKSCLIHTKRFCQVPGIQVPGSVSVGLWLLGGIITASHRHYQVHLSQRHTHIHTTRRIKKQRCKNITLPLWGKEIRQTGKHHLDVLNKTDHLVLESEDPSGSRY